MDDEMTIECGVFDRERRGEEDDGGKEGRLACGCG